MIGDFMIEVIEPSTVPGDQQAPLPKFRNRFGQHFHSLAWYVDVPDLAPLFHRLRMRRCADREARRRLVPRW